MLRDGPRTSGEIASQFDSSWPTISRHLNVLREAGLVIAERNGQEILLRTEYISLSGSRSALDRLDEANVSAAASTSAARDVNGGSVAWDHHRFDDP